MAGFYWFAQFQMNQGGSGNNGVASPLKVLEDRGLAVRRPNETDGRSHLLELTGEGRAIHGEVMPLAREIEREIFTTLAPSEREQLRDLLKRVFAQADKKGPA